MLHYIITWPICAEEEFEGRICWDESADQIVTVMIRVQGRE